MWQNHDSSEGLGSASRILKNLRFLGPKKSFALFRVSRHSLSALKPNLSAIENKQKQKKTACKPEAGQRRITHKHHYNAYMIAGLLSFPIIAFIISPFLHELFHMLVLKYYNCPYWADFHSSLRGGLYATVYLNCTLDKIQLVILYLAGITGTLAIGFSLLILDWCLTKKDYLEYSIFTSFIAMGFLFSPVIYFFSKEGDLINAFNVLNMSPPAYLLPLIGIGIMLFSLAYFYMNLKYTSEKELLEEEKEELDRFGIKKTQKKDRKKYMPK